MEKKIKPCHSPSLCDAQGCKNPVGCREVAAVDELQFLTDVVTAAGLLAYGKTDKGLARRISSHAYKIRDAITSAPQVVADERAAQADGILATTIELARCIWRDNYKNEAPDWEPFTDMAGVLSQIDNMVCGMRRAAPVQAQEPRKPTDISQRLREYAGNNGYSHNDYADTMRAAADEIERYYGGMMNWKATAEAKDRAPVQPVAVPDSAMLELPPLPKADVEGGYYDSESGVSKKAMQEYAIVYGQACHAMGRGAAVREYVENGTFAAPGAMPEPSKEQQAEYYRLYAEVEASFEHQPFVQYAPNSRLIHAEVVQRMNIKAAS